MKKIWMLVAVLCLVLAAGSAFGEEYGTMAKDPTSDPDSLINFLDPSNAPGAIMPAHKGLLGLTEEGLPGAGGWAAGGRGEMKDSLLFYLDPSYAPAEFVPKKTTTEVKPIDPDSIIHQISPVD